MGSPRRRKYGERLGGAPTQNYSYVRSVRLAAGMATANQPPRCARCRPTASEALSRSKKYIHNRADPACKGREYNKKQGLAPAATATGSVSTLLPGQQTIQSSLWGTQAPVAERRFGLSPGGSSLASPRASPAAVSPRGASAATRNEHTDHRVENSGSLAVASVAEGAAAAEDPWVDFKIEEDPFGDPAAVCHEVAMAGRELPTAAPRNIAQTTIHPVVVQTAAMMRVALGNVCDGAAAHGDDSRQLATHATIRGSLRLMRRFAAPTRGNLRTPRGGPSTERRCTTSHGIVSFRHCGSRTAGFRA